MNPVIDALTLGPNAGIFTTSTLTLTTGSLSNQGDIEIYELTVNGSATNDGFLSTSYLLAVDGDLSNSGTINPEMLQVGGEIDNSGLLDDQEVTAADYVQTGSDSVMYFFPGATLNASDATVSGGSFDLGPDSTVNADLSIDGGSFLPTSPAFGREDPGLVMGNFSIGSDGTYLEYLLNYPAPSWGQLAVFGTASLGGILDATFDPSKRVFDGETFSMMTYSAETGAFDQVEVAGLGQNQTVSLDYGPTSLSLVVHGNPPPIPAPEPDSLLLFAAGMAVLWRRYRGCSRRTGRRS